MKKSILICGFLFVLFTSCNKSEVYNKFDDGFTENRWKKEDTKTYDFSIEDDTKSYTMTFRFSHVYDYQFESIPVIFTIINPKGEEQKKEIDLQIKDKSGKELAECSVDVCDLSYKLEDNIKLSKGNYKVIVSHAFKGPYLPNVIGIGFKVEKLK